MSKKAGVRMDCKEVQRNIPLFLANGMREKKLLRLIDHLETCEECKEELTIQYLASEGIARLEAGKTFDLDRELTEHIDDIIKRQKRRKWIRIGVIGAELLAIAVILLVLAYAFWW